jgi:transcriptional regulator with XRE-family HTH domain
MLANVSVDYYVRLEQGRADNPSVTVLSAVADALRLDQAERDHLRALSCTTPRTSPPPVVVRPELKAMIEAMRDVPAVVVDRLSNVLAWNRGATVVIADFAETPHRNLARLYFLDPAAKRFYQDWEAVARDAVAMLRTASAEYADDPELSSLVDELRTASPDFERFWTSQDVAARSHCPKVLNHPTAGLLTFSLESLKLSGDDGQFVITYTPSDPTTQAALETLLTSQLGVGSYQRR